MIRNHTMPSRPYHSDRAEDPTPAEIRERCQEIRENWSESTLRHRAGQVDRPWTVPVAKHHSIAAFVEPLRG